MILAVRCTSCNAIRPAIEPACHRCRVARIRAALNYDHGSYGGRAPYRGLARSVYGVDLLRGRRSLPPAPWGWRWRKVRNIDARDCIPLWLYWLVEALERRYDWTFRPLCAMGLWRVREGALWTSGRFTAPRWLRAAVWCFLNDTDHYDYALLYPCAVRGCRRITYSLFSKLCFEHFMSPPHYYRD